MTAGKRAEMRRDRRSYAMRLGVPNPKGAAPVVMAGGIAWCTSKQAPGTIVVMPDAFAKRGLALPLPPGTAAITIDGERILT